MQSFVKVKSSKNGKITLSFTDRGKSALVANMSFNAIHENKILAKISKSTVFDVHLFCTLPTTQDRIPAWAGNIF